MKLIAARFRHDADLATGACSKFRWKVARLNTKFLYVLETRLQTKRRWHFTVQVAWTCVDDRAALNAVVSDHVLLIRATRKSDVSESSGSCILRSGRLQL